MTKKLMAWFLEKLGAPALAIGQVEAYEGQFDDPEDSAIFPPSAFVAVTGTTNEAKSMGLELEHTVTVYLVTTHMHQASTDNMYDLIDAVVAALHNKAVRYEKDTTPSTPPDTYMGRCFFKKSEWIGVFPGLTAYKLMFNIVRS